MRLFVSLALLCAAAAPAFAQTPAEIAKVFECVTPPANAEAALKALKQQSVERNADEDGRSTTTTYAPGKVRPFGFEVKKLSHTRESADGDKFEAFISLARGSLEDVQARVLAARGLSACPDLGEGYCKINTGTSDFDLTSIVLARRSRNETEIECFYEVTPSR
jgi:hypothetical protein